MKITRMILWGILLVFLPAFTGCTGRVAKFETMPEQPYDAGRGREISGGACGFQLIMFIPIKLNDRALRAYHQLAEEAKGDYVTDIKVNERWAYAVIGTVYCTEMQAMAYPKLAAASPSPEMKKSSSIDECVESCKKNTKRTAEQCFDVCNH